MVSVPISVKFLGTAGARFVVAKQLRSSAGTYLNISGKNIIIDPGPGTLVRLAKSKPPIDASKIDALIVTHVHIDHSNDVNILIDAMTGGGLKRRGLLFATEECLSGEDAVVLRYLRSFLEDIVVLKENSEYQIYGVKFRTSIRHMHSKETYGLIFDLGRETLSFLTDTKFFPGLSRSYAGTTILVINAVMVKPAENPRVLHLSLEDVKKLVLEIKPKKVILTHFGMTMIREKPWKVAEELGKELGVSVQAASDGMGLDI